jgi:hypothetical protein
MDSSSNSGSGTHSGSGSSNEKRGRKGKQSSNGSSGPRALGSSDSDTIIQNPTLSRKRSSSESPVDPVLSNDTPLTLNPNTSTHTLTTTITTHHPNDSKRSLRQKLSRRFSSSDKATVVDTEPKPLYPTTGMAPVRRSEDTSPDPLGRFSPEADPTWWDSDLAPAPLRVSRPPSEERRPYSSESRASQHKQGSRHRHSASGDSDRSANFSLPVRPRSGSGGTGIRRTESGGETYFADGVSPGDEEGEDVLGRRDGRSWGRGGGSGRARDAGRAF